MGIAALSWGMALAGCGTTVETVETSKADWDPPATEVPLSKPPPPGPAHPGDGTEVAAFAVSRLLWGNRRWDGTPDEEAWKTFGYDIDGANSGAESTGLCKPRKGGQPSFVYLDGVGGIDNAFGKSILPIFQGILTTFSDLNDPAITIDASAIVIALDALGEGQDYNPLHARLYHSRAALATSEGWPVSASDLTDPLDITSAKVSLAESYVTQGTWVSGVIPELTNYLFVLPELPLPLPLRIANLQITMNLSPGHLSATRGVISGIVPVSELILLIQLLCQGLIDCCDNPVNPSLPSIITQFEQAADILIDGTQDPNKECDGVSIGLGFEAQRVTLAGVTDPEPQLCYCDNCLP